MAVLTLVGCRDTEASGSGSESAPGDGIQGDLPPVTQTISELFVTDGEIDGLTKTVFRTNDKKYWTYEGATLWTVWGGSTGSFSSRTVKLTKTSGHSSGGYGIVFCHGEYEIDGKQTQVMLVVMINNDGQYLVGKTVGGVFTDFGWWKSTSYINKSPGFLNEIKLDYSGGRYVLRINGYEVDSFSDDSYPILSGGKNGYIVVISPYDNFPTSFVDVYFLEAR